MQLRLAPSACDFRPSHTLGISARLLSQYGSFKNRTTNSSDRKDAITLLHRLNESGLAQPVRKPHIPSTLLNAPLIPSHRLILPAAAMPAAGDQRAWEEYGTFNPDHGIAIEALASPPLEPMDVGDSPGEQQTARCGLGESISDAWQRAGGGALVIEAGDYNTTLGGEMGGALQVRQGYLAVMGRGGGRSRVWGRWNLTERSQGSLRGLTASCDMLLFDEALRRWGTLPCAEPMIRVLGGPWHFCACELRCSQGQVLRAMGNGTAALQMCCLGGRGSLGLRCWDAVVAKETSRVLLDACVVEAAGGIALRVQEDAHLSLRGPSALPPPRALLSAHRAVAAGT